MTIVQNHMGKGWDAADRDAANTEPTLAHPSWERVPAGQSFPTDKHFCHPCGVRWATDPENPEPCWMCGRTAELGDRAPSVMAGPQGTRGDFDYPSQPFVPAGGCGCADPTVDQVTDLITDGWSVWKAAFETYGGAS